MFAWTILYGCTGPDEGTGQHTDTSVDPPEECSGPYADLFDEAWEALQEEYPYFGLKGVDWHAVRATCRPDFCSDDMTYRNFVDRGMDCVLSPLSDNHVYIIDRDGEAHGYGGADGAKNYSLGDADAYLDGKGASFGKSRLVRAGVVSGTSVLYVRVESWANVDDVDFGEVLDILPEASGYVIDVRPNTGGNEGVAQRLAGKLIGGAAEPYSWAQYRDEQDGDPHTYEMTEPAGISIPEDLAADAVEPRPVALLIGSTCMSSCEGFVAMMVNSGLTRSFGTTTRGSTGNPRQTELSDGTILTSSRWYLMRADGVTPVEELGIAPDEEVEFVAAGVSDAVLDSALAWLDAG